MKSRWFAPIQDMGADTTVQLKMLLKEDLPASLDLDKSNGIGVFEARGSHWRRLNDNASLL